MATLEKIRSKAGLLVLVVGVALFAFIIGDFLNSGSTYFRQSQETVAEVDGEVIKIQEFQDRVAVIRKCPFKPLDTADLLSKRFLVQLLMHTVSHDFFHPAAIHERELSILRNPLEISV